MMTHHHLALKSAYRFKRNAYYYQYGSTAERKSSESGKILEYYREYRDYTEEYSADQRYL